MSKEPKPVVWYRTVDGWVTVAGFLFVLFILVSCANPPGRTSDKAWGQYTEALKQLQTER